MAYKAVSAVVDWLAGSAQRCVVRLDVMFPQVLLVLEQSLTDLTRHVLSGHVHVGDVLPQVARVAEHFVTQVTALWLHTLPFPPSACGHKSASELLLRPAGTPVPTISCKQPALQIFLQTQLT